MRFTAEVQGTATYQVELEWEPDCVGSMTCGCPYAQRGNRCKHMAAVLFAISSSHADWEEALERLPAEALRRLLHDLAARDEHLRERLVRTANGPGDTRELWTLDLQRMMNRYVPYGDWFDYHDAEQLMTDFSVYLEDNTEYLLRAGRLLDASRLTELVYGTAMEVQMDDSAGGLTMLMEDCHRIWNRLIEAADSRYSSRFSISSGVSQKPQTGSWAAMIWRIICSGPRGRSPCAGKISIVWTSGSVRVSWATGSCPGF